MTDAASAKIADEQMKILSLMGAIMFDRHIYEMRVIWCVMLQMVSFVTLTLALISPPELGQFAQFMFTAVPLIAIVGLEVPRRASVDDFQLVDKMLDVFSKRLQQSFEAVEKAKVPGIVS